MCPFTPKKAKGAILSITSGRSLSSIGTYNKNGGRRTGNWWSTPCQKMLRACKALTFRTEVAYNTMQVPLGCLSTRYTAAQFSNKHSAYPQRNAHDVGRNIRAVIA